MLCWVLLVCMKLEDFFFSSSCVHFDHKWALCTSHPHEMVYRVRWPRHPPCSSFLLTKSGTTLKTSGLFKLDFFRTFNLIISYCKNPVNKIMFLMVTLPILLYKLLLSMWDFVTTFFKPCSFCAWCIPWKTDLSCLGNNIFWQTIS